MNSFTIDGNDIVARRTCVRHGHRGLNSQHENGDHGRLDTVLTALTVFVTHMWSVIEEGGVRVVEGDPSEALIIRARERPGSGSQSFVGQRSS